MYSNPRPVPSNGSLKLLYQLAYISSGTAVGVGVLCAEERRKRTRVVQRIADNARKIRQHPRHVASVALDVKNGERSEEGTSRGTQQGALAARGMVQEDDGIKGMGLPSIVEKEYGNVVGRNERPRATRPKRLARAEVARQLPAKEPDGNTQVLSGSPEQSSHLTRLTREDSLRSKARHLHFRYVETVNRKKLNMRLDYAGASGQIVARPRSIGMKSAKGFQDRAGGAETDASQFSARKRYIHSQCLEHIRHGHLSAALDLLDEAHLGIECPGLCDGIMDKILETALEQKDLLVCSRVLRWKEETVGATTSALQRDWFIVACAMQERHDMLRERFFDKYRLPASAIAQLAPRSRAELAIACTHEGALFKDFGTLHHSLNASWRNVVVKRRCRTFLWQTWQSTGNLEAVLSNLRPIADHVMSVQDPVARDILDATMAEIYIRANNVPKALETISRLHDTGRTSGKCISLAASAFAKQGSWEELDRVLDLASDAVQPITADSRNNFIDSIHDYALDHSATETFKFATRVILDMKVRPNEVMTRTLLVAFVARRALYLIPAWFRFLRTLGHKVEMDSGLAVALMRRYFRDNRISHVFTMWFCRHLTDQLPMFDMNEFINLAKESIQHDLSGTSERSAVWQREHAEARLVQLQKASSRMPSPGFRWNKTIHFPDAEGRGNTYTTVPEAADGEDDSKWLSEQMIDSHDDQLSQYFQDPTAFTPAAHSRKTSGVRVKRDVALEMSLALSRHQYGLALQIYLSSRDKGGIRHSITALVIAVRASLKLHGNDSHATELIYDAQRIGVNVTPAMSPVIVHRLRDLGIHAQNSAAEIKSMVLEYYNMLDESGSPVSHYFGVTAANVLIVKGAPKYGLEILQWLYKSKRASTRPLDIVAMTVWLKGCIASRSLRDIDLVVKKVLHRNMRISKNFVRELKGAYKLSVRAFTDSEKRDIFDWIEQCRERRQHQEFRAKRLGHHLVQCIIKCARPDTPVDVDLRLELDRELFGEVKDVIEWPERPTIRGTKKGLAAQKALVAPTFMPEEDIDWEDARNAAHMEDWRWLKAYRAFHRKPLVLSDGRYASFRLRVPSESLKWRQAEQTRWKEQAAQGC